MEAKKDIMWRVYLVYFFILAFGVSIASRVMYIQFSQGDYWRSKAAALTIAKKEIEAVRGNIYDVNGNLLATSLPFYEIGMDVHTEYLTEQVFKEKVDSLAENLANLFKDRSKKEYKRMLKTARETHDRYVLLQKDVSHKDLQKIKKFPLFRLGRYKGGLIYVQKNKRERPFQMLAARTIGYDRAEAKPIGLEGAFNQYLKGISGTRLMQKIAGDVWMPLSNENDMEPQDGADIISTIDINLQDVAEHALLNQLINNKAAYGCVALMEVKTGEIKAIANLAKSDTGYYESFNYLIADATTPGSTFKLASYLALMEDGYVNLDTKVDLEDGRKKFCDREVKDSHKPEVPVVTVKRAFEISSNVAVTKLTTQFYGKNPQKFIDRLKQMNVGEKLNISIPGEGDSRIKNATDKDWSCTSLPWISYGYESRITPLQTLTLYNAVANDGIMVKPQFVKEVRSKGKTLLSFQPEIINPAICSKSTIQQAKKMMEGVVENGTAKNLINAPYKIAGKTGTAQLAQNGAYVKGSKDVTYQASFVGYFPAENPKYSCIIIVNAPSNGIYYGNVVAGPIFREIADKVYATSLDIHQAINNNNAIASTKLPAIKGGDKDQVIKTLELLKISAASIPNEQDWIQQADSTKVISFTPDEDLKNGIVPNVTGMVLKDALFLLENKGLHVKVKGSGTIVKQLPEAGTKFTKGTTIEIELI